MHRAGLVAVPIMVALLAGCDASAGTQQTLCRDPSHCLLGLDQLVTPDFTVAEPTHLVDVTTIAADGGATAQQLRRDGFAAAASIRYFRPTDLATANGPIDIISTAETFSSSHGAQQAFRSDIAHLDASSGNVPVSTGSLGDDAHADTLVRTDTTGIQAVQITLEWRVGNVLNVLIVRGRYGGTRLDDALVLAHRVTANET